MTIVITANTIDARDAFVRKLYSQLTSEPSTTYIVVQDRLNRIQIYQRTKSGYRILVKTYLVIVLPVHINLAPLTELTGTVDFHLDYTIDTVQKLLTKLKSLQGTHELKGAMNGKTFEQLVRSLSDAND